MQLDLGLNLGIYNSSSSAPVNWTPAKLPNLALWLDAADSSTITLNGSTVSQWRDKSGNGRHASQNTAANQPTYTANGLNGKPVVTFDGSNDFMAFQTAFGTVTEFNAVIVWRTDASGVGNFDYLYQIGDGSNALSLNAASPTAGSFNGNYYGLTSATTPSALDFNTAAVFNAAAITSHRIGTGTTHNLWVNGSARTVPSWPSSLNVDSSNSGLGRFINNNAHFLQGYIAEIVFVTNSALSTADRQLLEGYLAWKWALEANLPSGHPFKNTPPTV